MRATIQQTRLDATLRQHSLNANLGNQSSSSSQPSERLTYSGITGESINGHRVVCTNLQGQLIYMGVDSPSISSIIGISNHAAAMNQPLTLTTYGKMEESSWNWLPTQALYLNANGVLSHAAPLMGNYIFLGFSITPTKIFVSIKQPILRS